jgi:hypothetical protein
MLRRTLVGLGLVLVIGSSPSAQNQSSAAQEREAAAQARTQAQQKEKEKEAAESVRKTLEIAKAQEQERREREVGQPINVRVELTIRDQRGTAPPDTKTVSIVTADRTNGRVRTGGNIRTEKFGIQEVRLNVDARPVILRDGQIRLFVTFEYRPADTEASPSNNISEMLECVLASGQSLGVTKSADPNSDRSVTVEVKATILK